MSRTSRKRSEADIYHVFARGVGRQMIFEDDDDNEFFLGLLERFLEERDGSLFAWCLMGNHFRLLIRMRIEELSKFMKRLEVAYAGYFNARYDRPGCLFQGRFGSEPIVGDGQFLAAIRYIHLNPQKAGIGKFDEYKWSSYGEYASGSRMCDTDFALDAVGGMKAFEELHRAGDGSISFMEENASSGNIRRHRLSDGEVRRILESECGPTWRTSLSLRAKGERDGILSHLKSQGASVRQISRITGLGRGIVQTARNRP